MRSFSYEILALFVASIFNLFLSCGLFHRKFVSLTGISTMVRHFLLSAVINICFFAYLWILENIVYCHQNWLSFHWTKLDLLIGEMKSILFGVCEFENIQEACLKLTKEFFRDDTLLVLILCLPKLNLEVSNSSPNIFGIKVWCNLEFLPVAYHWCNIFLLCS